MKLANTNTACYNYSKSQCRKKINILWRRTKMNIQSTIFSRAKMKSFKRQSLFVTILGIVLLVLAFSFMGDWIRGMDKTTKSFMDIFLLFGGLVVTAFGIRGLVIAPKIEAYLNLTGRESCTGREYEEWAAKYVPANNNAKANNTNYGSNAKGAAPSQNRVKGAAPSQNRANVNTAYSQPKYRIVICPHCGAQIRLPDNGKKLNVTCPRCTKKFIV